MAQTIQKSFKSLSISSTRSSAHMLDLLWLTLLLSPAINFNQILCTQLYSCLKPSKVLLLLRKPLPRYPCTRLRCLLPSISTPFPIPIFPKLQGAKLALHYEHWAIYHPPAKTPWSASSLETHKKSLQLEFVVFQVWLSLHRPVMFNYSLCSKRQADPNGLQERGALTHCEKRQNTQL